MIRRGTKRVDALFLENRLDVIFNKLRIMPTVRD